MVAFEFIHSEFSNFVRGGFCSLIYRLFWGFDDGVLWFVKVILFLYLTFYVFLFIRVKYGKTYAVVSFNVLTILVCVLSLWMVGCFSVISIPMFMLGTLYSLYYNENDGVFNKSQACFVCWGFIMCTATLFESLGMCLHTAINYFLIFLLLLLQAKYNFCVKRAAPVIVCGISFDIYLVHGKVLASLEGLMNHVPLSYFVCLSAAFVLAFYFLRTKLKI